MKRRYISAILILSLAFTGLCSCGKTAGSQTGQEDLQQIQQAVTTDVNNTTALSTPSDNPLVLKLLKAQEEGDIVAQREALTELHKINPSDSYINAISKIPVQIQDPMALRYIRDIFDSVSEKDASMAMDMVRSDIWNEFFADSLAGVKKISIYNMGKRIVPIAAAGVAVGEKLQIRVESDAYTTVIRWLDGTDYRYLYCDAAGLTYFATTVENGKYESAFSEMRFNHKGENIEVVKGTFDNGLMKGEVKATILDKQYAADVTSKNYDVQTVLGLEGYTDFTSFAKVEYKENDFKSFEDVIKAQVEHNNKVIDTITKGASSEILKKMPELTLVATGETANKPSSNQTPANNGSTSSAPQISNDKTIGKDGSIGTESGFYD